jgi:WD40 repeat protein
VVVFTLLAVLAIHPIEKITVFPYKEYISTISFASDSKTFTLSSGMGTIGTCNVDGKWIRGKIMNKGKLLSLRYSEDGNRFGIGNENGYFAIWDSSGNALLYDKMPEDSLLRTSVNFTPDLGMALVGFYSGQVAIWDVQKKQIAKKFRAHSNAILDIAYSTTGDYFLTASADSTAKLWTLTGDSLQVFKTKKEIVYAADISPDGNTIATGDKAGMLYIWDLSGNLKQSIKAHKDKITDLHFSPDGKQILTTCGGNYENTAKLWTLEGEAIRLFNGHSVEIRSCAFAPDNSAIATGDASGKLIIWRLSKKAD